MDRSEEKKMSIAARASRDAAITAAPILNTPLEVCPRCRVKYGGVRPAYFASDPVCAFPGGERFTGGNWQCATVGLIRDLVGEYAGDVERAGITVVHNGDQKLATVVLHDGIELPVETEDREGWPVALVVTWYKRRGSTNGAWLLLDDGTALPPSVGDIEAICAGYADDTGSERSEHRDAQTNTSLHSEEKEETR